jgi:pyridoxal phosphate enzyme (YggS family)
MSALVGSEGSSSSGADVSEDQIYLVQNAGNVMKRIQEASTKVGRDINSVQLVAVSKTKPAADIAALYAAGYRKFGENYFQELTEKAPTLPQDIQWHFIGHLQSGKASKLVREVPNLAVVETVDSMKLASKLNNACESAERDSLKIYLQVDTSGEDTKSGVLPAEAAGLATEIKAQCPRLEIAGLMTIGAPGDLSCFDRLVETRLEVAATLGVPLESLG